ncbi:DUF4926 domain-containing protein [Salmonella enterica]|uniref:DUF4926 domain-containing protein n=1 Tax=Salmonella enterica TaxID=28901 RepID=UPI0010135148|nr:DUF4926 domain-containing protein [Salmonella enterica]
MKYNINDVVEILIDIPHENIKSGSVGVIVELFDDQTDFFYEVEFCNSNGETLTTISLNEKYIRKHF